MRSRLAALILALAAPAAAQDIPLALDGQTMQGALVIGRTVPGAAVTLDGKPLKVDETGAFVLGFARDAKPEAALAIKAPDGRSLVRTLAVRQRQYRIQRIDGLPKGMVEPDKELMKRLEEEYYLVRRARETDTRQPFWKTGFKWPSLGPITGVYGSQRILNGKPMQPHFGVDVGAPTGAPVRAAAAGTVTLAYDQLYFAGRSVMIDHGMGVSTIYIHLNEIKVKQGDTVAQGQLIGTIGNTGRSTGAHLHWGLNWFHEPLDPATVVGPMPGRGPGQKSGKK
jgi:murein DD-endopeptidase MepM/ murein hydrolase activator NlpD